MPYKPKLPRWVDPDVYRSESVLAQELERVFPASWLAVARESDVPAPGRYRCVDEVGAALVVLRDAQGEVGVFQNRCRHRGTRLLDGAGALPGGRVRCPYHGWCYGPDGALLAASGGDAFPRGVMTTGLAARLSDSENGRPRVSGIPMRER